MMKVKPKNNIELEGMRAAGRLAAEVLDYITPHVKPGVSTLQLNDMAHEFTVQRGAISAPLNYKGFPKSVCTSVNEVVCHGIPAADELLQDSDIINIDVTVIVDGWHGDTSRMFLVGDVDNEGKALVQNTYDAMMAGIGAVHSGADISDIGRAVHAALERHGYGIVRDYCGHGIGKTFHDQPMVVHYATNDPRYRMKLRRGHTFTVEPMVNLGTHETELLPDGWTVKTRDRKRSAQFEHTIAVTDEGAEILTASPAGYTCPPYV